MLVGSEALPGRGFGVPGSGRRSRLPSANPHHGGRVGLPGVVEELLVEVVADGFVLDGRGPESVPNALFAAYEWNQVSGERRSVRGRCHCGRNGARRTGVEEVWVMGKQDPPPPEKEGGGKHSAPPNPGEKDGQVQGPPPSPREPRPGRHGR